jgi:hypothetical protein
LFAGILRADKANKVGIRFWGPPPTALDRLWVANVMRTPQFTPTTRIRVRGYAADFGLPHTNGSSLAQLEAAVAFSPATVEVVTCHHMAKSGLRNPVWDLTVRGVPLAWQGQVIPSRDSREKDKVWQLCTQSHRPLPFQAMGPRENLNLVSQPTPEEEESDSEMDEDLERAEDLKDQLHPKED